MVNSKVLGRLKFRENKKWYFIVILGVVLFLLFFFTGFLQKNGVDSRDLNRWNYSNGVIEGAEAFNLLGDNHTCWVLIHSYAATPIEMKELAHEIYDEFSDSVYVIRLEGHGEVPSKLYNLSLDDWYLQVSNIYEDVSSECENVNVVGSSFGGALSIRLAEDYDFKSLFVVNGYLAPTYKWYTVFNLNFYLDIFTPVLHYSKKVKSARINDPEGLKNHVAYLNFVFSSVRDSRNFLADTYINISSVNENLLIQHSTGDSVADPNPVEDFFNMASSNSKEMVWFEKSDHVILSDYDSEEAIKNIIEFEKKNR